MTGGAEAGATAGSWFSRCFGRRAGVAWRAPGRVNLIGEHTDYNDGLVLPFALSGAIVAAAAARDDGLLELCSRQVPDQKVSIRLRDLAPGSVTGWAAYPAGAAWALREIGSQLAGASVAIDSDLPQGAGLASSAALECAVASCLADLVGLRPSRQELVGLARRAENDFVGMPCGIMDQSAVMFCAAGHALLLDCRTGDHAAVPLDPAVEGLSLMIIDTGVRHELVGGEYAIRRQECERAARALGVAALRDVEDTAGLAVLADRLLARRARHVVSENDRVGQVAGLLTQGRLAGCGTLLTQSHLSLRDDFEVSWPAADAVVDAALAAGALGARMTGAGFGGCVLALLPVDRMAQVKRGVRTAVAELGGAEPAFIDAVPGQGARRIGLS